MSFRTGIAYRLTQIDYLGFIDSTSIVRLATGLYLLSMMELQQQRLEEQFGQLLEE